MNENIYKKIEGDTVLELIPKNNDIDNFIYYFINEYGYDNNIDIIYFMKEAQKHKFNSDQKVEAWVKYLTKKSKQKGELTPRVEYNPPSTTTIKNSMYGEPTMCSIDKCNIM